MTSAVCKVRWGKASQIEAGRVADQVNRLAKLNRQKGLISGISRDMLGLVKESASGGTDALVKAGCLWSSLTTVQSQDTSGPVHKSRGCLTS